MTRRGRGRGRGRALALLSTALLVLACGDADGGGTDTLSDSVYVEVMARLVVLDSALSPTLERAPDGRDRADSLRARILEAWDVDADRLLDYARDRGGDPERMEAVWRRVDELSDSLAAEGWRPPGAPAPGDTAGGAPDDTTDGRGGDPAGGDDGPSGAAPDTAVGSAPGRP